MSARIFALVDCNNFYVSCERLFRPDLQKRPVIVLSNNDGCVVARSPEAKALGIGMAVPAYQIRHIIERENVVVFSSNYTLYADISARVMTTLEHMVESMEVYSIDEAFLDWSVWANDHSLKELGQMIRERIYRNVGIQVSVGIAHTRTLAKLANFAAKKYPATKGVVDLRDTRRRDNLLRITPAGEVWNVGRRTTQKLATMGIDTAWQLSESDPITMKRQFSINIARTIHELNGVCCYEHTDVPPARKQVLCSRSFGSPVKSLESLELAVAEYASRAAEKLREQKLLAGIISVFVRTNHHNPHQPQYSNSVTGEFIHPTADTRHILERSRSLLHSIWKEGYGYAKAGVWLAELQPEAAYQPGLFEDSAERNRSHALMEALDRINRRGESIWFAAKGAGMDKHMRRANVSPAYTTRWNDLPLVR